MTNWLQKDEEPESKSKEQTIQEQQNLNTRCIFTDSSIFKRSLSRRLTALIAFAFKINQYYEIYNT